MHIPRAPTPARFFLFAPHQPRSQTKPLGRRNFGGALAPPLLPLPPYPIYAYAQICF